MWDLEHLTELTAIKMYHIVTLRSAASEATDVPHPEQVSPRIRQIKTPARAITNDSVLGVSG